jgi:hypothetical protein
MDRPGSGLRRLVGLLLVLNLGVLGFGFGAEYWRGQSAPPLTFNADKIRLVSEPGPQLQAAAKPVAPAQEPPAETEVESAPGCLAWKGLDADDLAEVEADLKRAGVAASGYDLTLGKKLGWWVFLPPQQDAEALRATMKAIRAKGVEDLAAVRSGSMANAISLGVFPTLQRARARAAQMAGKGIAGVRYAPRPGAGEVRLHLDAKLSRDVVAKIGDAWSSKLRPRACSGN